MSPLFCDMGQAVSPRMSGDEIQEQGISVGKGFFKFGKTLHVIRPQTESREALTALTTHYASNSYDVQVNH
jgi:hypothetical protein